jgi:hypothetical protein
MSKQFWDFQVTLNNFNKPAVQDDCVVTFVELGKTRSWQSNKGDMYWYRKVSVAGPDGNLITTGFETQWSGQESDEPAEFRELNVPVECRVKPAMDNSQYAYNGKKYTFSLKGAGKPSGGGGGQQRQQQQNSYTPSKPKEDVDWDKIARGKCFYGIMCSAINNGQLDTRVKPDGNQIDIIDMLSDLCMAAGK